MVAFKLFGLLTFLMTLAILQVDAMQCKGPNLKTKKDGLLCGGQYIPYDGEMCGSICSCDGSTLTCKPPSDCTAQTTGWDSVEDFCHIGPNYDWSCQCPEKQADADVHIVLPSPANFTPAIVTPTGHSPFHGPQIFPTPHSPPASVPTTMHTSIVPNAALVQNTETCTFRLGTGDCGDDFPLEIAVGKDTCVPVTNGDIKTNSYEVTDCGNSFDYCFFFDDDVCNGGSFEKALQYRNHKSKTCSALPGGKDFTIGSIYCP